MFQNMKDYSNNNINNMPNMNNNMNMMPIMNNNMGMNQMNNNQMYNNMNMNQINNNMNVNQINNNINMNQINNNLFNPMQMNMNQINFMNNDINNMNNNMMNINQMMNDMNINQQMQMQMMQEQMQKVHAQNNMAYLDNEIIEKQNKIKKRINNYYISKLYEIDFRRIEAQNEHFKEIINKLMSHIKNLEERIEYNNKIMNKYLEEANNNINYKNLLDLSSTIEDIYDNKLNEFNIIINKIKNIYKLGIEELRKNYLDDFNKKYNFNQCKIVDEAYIGFRNTSLLNIILDQVTFNELCRIDFKNIHELELRFEDYLDINILTKVTYHNISFLGLSGKIKDITILTKLPFKLLTTLRLSLNDFYDTSIDIFSNMPFNKLQILLLDNNKINNIIGLTKAPFNELTNLNLGDNKISNLKPILEFPFKKLDKLTLDNNCIEDIKYLSNAPFDNLTYLSLRRNEISDISPLSNVKFIGLRTLLLDNNQISNIEVFSRVPFTSLNQLFLRDNKIIDINVFTNIPFIYIMDLRLSHNKIHNFEALFLSPIKNGANIYLDKYQYHNIANQNGFSNILNKYNLKSE